MFQFGLVPYGEVGVDATAAVARAQGVARVNHIRHAIAYVTTLIAAFAVPESPYEIELRRAYTSL